MMNAQDSIILALAAVACYLIVKAGKGTAPEWSADLGSAVYSWRDDGGTHITPDAGVNVGSLFNTGLGGGYATGAVGGAIFDQNYTGTGGRF